MKKLIASILALLLLAIPLVACSPPGNNNTVITTLPENMTGTEAIRLMLANERLNAQLLKDSENIFETGSAAMSKLATTAKENLVRISYASAAPDANSATLSNRVDAGDGSYVEIDGNRYVWKNFPEYSESYSYFQNLTSAVVSSAESGSELIDNIKKNVRVVDKWVKMPEGYYYLHVEDNMELLLFRDINAEPQNEACLRYKNADGDNVYEVYITNYVGDSRMIYIPGKKCEYSFQPNNGANHDFLAENTKGFWEVVDVGRAESDNTTSYNVSCMVLKDDICYDAFYNPSSYEQCINTLKILSADKKTDILWYSPYPESSLITLQLQGFDGLDHMELIDTDGSAIYQDTYEGTTVYIPRGKSATVVTKNGTRIKETDTFLNGKITVSRITLRHTWLDLNVGARYAPSLDIMIAANTREEVIALLEQFLALVGLSCRRDMNDVKAGMSQALLELEQFTKFHKWNENLITDCNTLAQGFVNREAKFQAWRDRFTAAANAPVVDYDNKGEMTLAMHFAEVSASGKASIEEMEVSLNGLSLSVTDTMLFVVDEPYVVNVALVGVNGTDSTLNHIDLGELPTTPFAEAESFTVHASGSLPLPIIATGNYTLVAYISTADGIRSSGYVAVPFESITPFAKKSGQLQFTTAAASDGTLLLQVTELKDIEVALDMPETDTHSYLTMYEALSEHAYRYGFVADGAVIEALNEDGTWTPIAVNEEALASGTYRLAYCIKNGDTVKNGTIYTVYTAPTA